MWLIETLDSRGERSSALRGALLPSNLANDLNEALEAVRRRGLESRLASIGHPRPSCKTEKEPY